MLKEFKKAGGAGNVVRQERKGGQSLLPSARPEMRIHDIPLSQLLPNSHQPRRFFASEELQSLAESMRLRGLKQPIVVRPMADGQHFMVVAGERRWRAAELCGWEKIHAVWSLIDDNGLDSLLENVQRQDLLPLEIADHMVRLRDREGISMREIAVVAGYREDEASRLTKISALPDSIRDDYFASADGRAVRSGALYEIAMASSPELQEKLWALAKAGTAVATLRMARKSGIGSEKKSLPKPKPPQQGILRAVTAIRKQISSLSIQGSAMQATLQDPTAREALLSLHQELSIFLEKTQSK
jgi:ParB family chromosome partitioning protein